MTEDVIILFWFFNCTEDSSLVTAYSWWYSWTALTLKFYFKGVKFGGFFFSDRRSVTIGCGFFEMSYSYVYFKMTFFLLFSSIRTEIIFGSEFIKLSLSFCDYFSFLFKFNFVKIYDICEPWEDWTSRIFWSRFPKASSTFWSIWVWMELSIFASRVNSSSYGKSF